MEYSVIGSTSVFGTESPGSNPGIPAIDALSHVTQKGRLGFMRVFLDDEQPEPNGSGVRTVGSAETVALLCTSDVSTLSLDFDLLDDDTAQTVLEFLREHPALLTNLWCKCRAGKVHCS